MTSVGFGGRLDRWYNGIQMTLYNPFGIFKNTGNYKEILLSQSFNTSGVGEFPHNHLITSAVKFGLLPVLIYIIYNLTLILRVYLALKKYRAIIILSILFYQFNTMFHNAGMLLGEQNGWYMFGIIESLLAIERRRISYKLKEREDN